MSVLQQAGQTERSPATGLSRRALGVAAACLLAACTTPAVYVPQPGVWRGRLALNTEGPRPQSFSASFELIGSAQRGELEIYNPLGNIVAKLSWLPDIATVSTGAEQRSSASLDELVAQVLGTAIPVQALFAWLQGDAQAVVGWQVDLTRYTQGRINAVREQPLPRASLRVVLQSPDA